MLPTAVRCSFIILLFIHSSCVLASSPSSESDSSEERANWTTTITGPVCGPYAACSAMRLLGSDCAPKDLVSARYIGSCEGSSGDEIVAAIEDNGFRAQPASGLSVLDLSVAGSPFLALVRPETVAKRYTHWVTVVPFEGGFTIFDSGRRSSFVTGAELMATWSGVGVFVSRRSDDSPMVNILLFRSLQFTTLMLICVLVWRVVPKLPGVGSERDFLLFSTLFVVVCSLVLICFADLPNLSRGSSMAAAPYFQVDEVPLEYAIECQKSSGAILVDARREVDFAAGTIPGSLNVPVYARRYDIFEYLDGRNIRKEQQIYVFCQSDRCDFDETIAKQLCSLGYSNIAVCSAGYREFLQHRSSATGVEK